MRFCYQGQDSGGFHFYLFIIAEEEIDQRFYVLYKQLKSYCLELEDCVLYSKEEEMKFSFLKSNKMRYIMSHMGN